MGLKKKISFVGRSIVWLSGVCAYFGSIIKAITTFNFWYIFTAVVCLICLSILSIHNEWRRYAK